MHQRMNDTVFTFDGLSVQVPAPDPKTVYDLLCRGLGAIPGSEFTTDTYNAADEDGALPRPTNELWPSEGENVSDSAQPVGMPALNHNAALAEILRSNFPWLGTDDEVCGSDVVDQLSSFYSSLRAAPAPATLQRLTAEELLRNLQAAQKIALDCCSALEDALGYRLDETTDFSRLTIADLNEAFGN